jgi:hypothetical protein
LASISHGIIKRRLDAIKSRSKAKSAAGARKVYAGLKGVFQLGVDHEVLDENPVKNSIVPRALMSVSVSFPTTNLSRSGKRQKKLADPMGRLFAC